MRRAAMGLVTLCLALGGALAASVLAGAAPKSHSTDSVSTTTGTTTTVPTTTPPPHKKPHAPSRIADGVTVGGVYVGGLEPRAARGVVRASFAAPLVVVVGTHRVSLSPLRLGAHAYVVPAVTQALHARPGSAVNLAVRVPGAPVRAVVGRLKKRYARDAVDAQVHLVNLHPAISAGHAGLAIDRNATVRAILRALHENRRGPMSLPTRVVRQARTETHFGPVIVIHRGSNQLYLYRTTKFWRRFPVATGQAAYPTPLGHFDIVVKWRNPWWYPPPSPWAQGLSPVPPGPGNPLGTRWMGLSAPGVGIHGTPDPASIGYSASHGCIRMYIPNAEWLFDHVEIGTPVFIVAA